MTDDIQWEVVGGEVFQGRQAVLQALEQVDGSSILELSIWHVVTHGRSGAVNGTIQYAGAVRGFCDVFEFGCAKGTSVCQITSYQVDV